MDKYISKPVVIEAVQWASGEPEDEIELLLGKSFESWIPSKQQLIIRTLEGEFAASKGDWSIKGTRGEFYPCKPDVFETKYTKWPEA